MAHVSGEAPTIKLYTNHLCPFAQRAHIVLKELGLKYEEVIIDLNKPREPWYLELNPRGLVPTIQFNGELITESAIVATFLADAYPSHLFPASGNPKDALTRARINFFVDTWGSKIGGLWFQLPRAEGEEQAKLASDFVSIVTKEIEPLLKHANPFFGGSSKLTLAEALVAPFILRIWAAGNEGWFPASVLEGFEKLPNFSKWAKAVRANDSVIEIWDEKAVVEGTRKKIDSFKAQAKAGSK